MSKAKIELVFRDDVVYVNFWNYLNGRDVIGEFKNGELKVRGKTVTLEKYIEMVKRRVKEQEKHEQWKNS